MIIGKLRPSIYLCCMAMVWSGVSAATCGVTNSQGLIAIRFFLGIVEAPLFPGVRFPNYHHTADASDLTVM
jgi:tRNA(Arg) A34 adenosine deaminase TadA